MKKIDIEKIAADESCYISRIIDDQGIAGYIADLETHELIYLTHTCMRWFGLDGSEKYRGRKCYEILQGLDAPCPFCTNDKLPEDGGKYCWEIFNEKLKRWVKVEDSRIEIDGRRCRLEIARDITDSKAKLDRLSDKLTTESALLACVKALSAGKDTEQAVNDFLNIIGEFYEAGRAYIFETDPDGKTISNTFEWCAGGVTAEIDRLQKLPLKLVEGWIKKFKKEGKFFISSVEKELNPDADTSRILAAQNINSLMAFPFVKDGNVFGFLGVDDPAVNQNNWTLLGSAVTFIMQELDKRRLLEELRHTSYTDMLTGLGNRNYYNTVVSRYQADPCDKLAVIFLDLDRLKEINDTYGHRAGDRHIISTADVLKKVFDKDEIFRTGGDEFVVFLQGRGYDYLVKKMNELHLRLKRADVTCSFGTCYRKNCSNVAEMLVEAENEMYIYKRRHHRDATDGRRGISFAEVVKADIDSGRFFPVLQPKVDPYKNRIVGAESLVRETRRDGTVVGPVEFIPLLEKNRCVDLLDYFMVEETCKLQKRFISEYGAEIPLSVNVSRVTLLIESFARDMETLFDKYRVPHSSVRFEVTESVDLASEDVIAHCADLRSKGFVFEIDDFGSHFTNIGFLAIGIFSTVKIDRDVIGRLKSDSITREIIDFIVDKCHRRNITVLAEGVETDEEYETVCDMGFDEVQGFYYDRPMSAMDFEEKYMKNLPQ